MQKNTLREIFNRIRRDDNSAIEDLYKEYNGLIYGIAYSLVKNKEIAEDIMQNIYLKIVKIDKSLLPKDYEKSWLYTVTKNETLNYIKKLNKEINIDDIYEISKEDENLNKIIDKDTYNKIINKLNKKDKEIVSLKILGDRKFREISEILKIPIGTVQWRYYKALNTIKILIGNIAIFVLTFSLYIGKNIKKSYMKKNSSESINEINIEKQESIEDKEDKEVIGNEFEESADTKKNMESISTEENRLEKDIQESVENLEKDENLTLENTEIKVLDYMDIGILSISGIFFVITIILSITIVKDKIKKKR